MIQFEIFVEPKRLVLLQHAKLDIVNIILYNDNLICNFSNVNKHTHTMLCTQ